MTDDYPPERGVPRPLYQPHVAVLLGCKIVFPGRHLDAEHLLDLISNEGATFTTAVPTVALSLFPAWMAMVVAAPALTVEV